MATVNEFTGNWTYRSFINDPDTNPDIDTVAKKILLAMAELTLTVGRSHGASLGFEVGGVSAGLDLGEGSEVSGKIFMGPGYELVVSGIAKSGKPPTIRFRGTGVEGTSTAGWIYDYLGYLSPSWPNGVGQVPAIVGTAIRTVAHPSSGGKGISPAGVVLSFIAVSRDHPAGS